MRIQSREFLIVQHFGGGRDIPPLVGMTESASLASEMSESVLMESMVLQANG